MNDKRIALIDSDSLLYICLYSKKDEPIKTLDQCRIALDVIINNILNYTKATHYILTLTIGRNFRYNVRSDYKSNRVADKPNYFSECRQYLIDFHQAIHHPDLESDDLVNIYRNKLENSFICACDSDILYGLEGQHFNYRTFQWVNTNVEEATYKFWNDIIAGTHNGVAGLKGKGNKYVEKLFSNLSQYGENYRNIVFNEYINHYNDEAIGIEEFYKNYKVLKILNEYEGLEFITPIEIVKEDYNLID